MRVMLTISLKFPFWKGNAIFYRSGTFQRSPFSPKSFKFLMNSWGTGVIIVLPVEQITM